MPNYLFLKPCRAERMTRSVVKTSQGTMTTSILNLRTAGMSLSTCESWSKNQRRLQKMYVPPAKLLRRKSVAANRRAGRTAGLTIASMIFSVFFVPLLFQASTAGHCFRLPLCSQPGAVCRRGFTSAARRLPLSWNDMRRGRVRNSEDLAVPKLSQNLAGDHSVQSRLRMPETIAVRDARPPLISPTLVVE